jgi:hypothetical protein
VWRPIEKPLDGLAVGNTVDLETTMRFDSTSSFGELIVVSKSIPRSDPASARLLPGLHDASGGERTQ